MTSPLTFPEHPTKADPAVSTAAPDQGAGGAGRHGGDVKAASAATVTAFGQTGAPTCQPIRCPWDRLSGAAIRILTHGVLSKAQGFVRTCRFPGLSPHHGGLSASRPGRAGPRARSTSRLAATCCSATFPQPHHALLGG